MELHNIVGNYDYLMLLRLGAGPTADVKPGTIELVENSRPVQAHKRRYPPIRRKFIDNCAAKLRQYGFAKISNDEQWFSAPLIVPKAPPANFHFTVALRPINAATKPTVWLIHSLDTEIGDMRERNFFASIDFVSAYCKLPMVDDSQPLHEFITTNSVMQTSRALQGAQRWSQLPRESSTLLL